jgi:hypothetical protein
MPIYEEQLISPFAIRFTQEHIRTTFRDGRSVEATIEEIYAESSIQEQNADYDVILRFPFPAMEIIRWRASERQSHAVELSNDLGEELTGEHWFTLDNRRLFCLQRAAAACWPRRVAVAADILRTSPGSVKRKYDTTTYGCSVTIAASSRDAPIKRWDWRQEVFKCEQGKRFSINTREHAALDMVLTDDAKPTMEHLSDMPGETCSAVARALMSLEAETEKAHFDQDAQQLKRSVTPSTHAPSETGSDSISDNDSNSQGRMSSNNSRESVASQKESKGEGEYDDCSSEWTKWSAYHTHAWWAAEEVRSQLSIPGNNGYVWVDNWSEIYASYLGSLREFLENHPREFEVIPGKGRGFRVAAVAPEAKQRFTARQKGRKQWRNKVCRQ